MSTPPRAMRTPYAGCPLCAEPELAELRVADCSAHPLYDPRLPPTLRWMRCTACAHVFVDGHFTEEASAILFARANPHQLPGWSTDQSSRLVHGRVVASVVRWRPRPGGRWLDIGFGNGQLLQAADEFGFEAVGLDLRREAVEALRELGFEAHCEDLQRFDAPTFDVISLADALEHMPFPKQALLRIRDLLAADGHLFLSMPNQDCFAWRVYDHHGANPYWREIEHLHNFGRRRLHALLAECGFEPQAYGVSERYIAGMEVVAAKRALPRS
jgi:SAM-dependent methyltransferase